MWWQLLSIYCVKKKQEEEAKLLAQNKKSVFECCYDDKDDAKFLHAWWDADKKKWYAPNNSARYTALIEKYSWLFFKCAIIHK